MLFNLPGEFQVFVTVHGTNTISANARGQAHFSATTFSPDNANTRRKMSQTPACERFQVFDAFVSPRVNSTGESLDNDILLLCV